MTIGVGRRCSTSAQLHDLVAEHEHLHVPAEVGDARRQRLEHLGRGRAPGLRRHEVDADPADAEIRHPLQLGLRTLASTTATPRAPRRSSPARPACSGCRCRRSKDCTITARVVPIRRCSARYACSGASGGFRVQCGEARKRGSKMCMWQSHAPVGAASFGLGARGKRHLSSAIMAIARSAQSTFAPESFTTFPQRPMSALRSAANSLRRTAQHLAAFGASFARTSGSLRTLFTSVVQALDDFRRRLRRDQQAEPGRRVEALVAGLGDGRHLGQLRAALRARHRDRAQLAALDLERASAPRT